ncbi:MAG: hypothetical protein JSR45_14035 [Proteobacteria bacterium]|nr:hypothetical protein [Pseudomonadota bacterium]
MAQVVFISILGECGRASLRTLERQYGALVGLPGPAEMSLTRSSGSGGHCRAFAVPVEALAPLLAMEAQGGQIRPGLFVKVEQSPDLSGFSWSGPGAAALSDTQRARMGAPTLPESWIEAFSALVLEKRSPSGSSVDGEAFALTRWPSAGRP